MGQGCTVVYRATKLFLPLLNSSIVSGAWILFSQSYGVVCKISLYQSLYCPSSVDALCQYLCFGGLNRLLCWHIPMYSNAQYVRQFNFEFL